MVTSTAAFQSVPIALESQRRGPIDLVHLARQSLGDQGLQEEILRVFAQRIIVYYERIEMSTGLEELVGHLHVLRSAAVGVGAWSLAELAGVAEDELRAGAPVNPERIEDLGMAVQEVSGFIEQLVAQRPDA